jgi:membrane protein YqaA with SNARE-associated domain
MFLTAFGAATLLPFGSEPLFIGYLVTQSAPALPLFIVASVGNILGGVVNYYCGIGLEKGNNRFSWVAGKHIEKAKYYFNRFGGYTLLFSWVFILGDPLTVVAGIARYPFWKFLILMSIGKIARFAFLWAGVMGYYIFTG